MPSEFSIESKTPGAFTARPDQKTCSCFHYGQHIVEFDMGVISLKNLWS